MKSVTECENNKKRKRLDVQQKANGNMMRWSAMNGELKGVIHLLWANR